jgi:SAM-dependent methyltransferase
MELLLGCGNNRQKRIRHGDVPQTWIQLVTLDIDPGVNPDVVHDLRVMPLPFDDDMFDEIHAYEVLEHCGQQGDWRLFLNQFEELWRILKPGGLLVGTCPMWDSKWAWSDPGHSRVITRWSMVYLDQDEYSQVGKTSLTDYRHWYRGNLKLVAINEENDTFGFVLKAIK